VSTRWSRLCAPGALILATLLLPSCTAGAGPTQPCSNGWHVLIDRASAHESSELFGVYAASGSDVWAVGVARSAARPARTLIEHWQGERWRVFPGPDSLSGDSFLNAVVGVSPRDAWAVGLSRTPGGSARTLILHWDGRRWSVIASPNAGPGDNALVAVAAASESDIWAVGYRDSGSVYRSLVEHWDGNRWRIVAVPLHSGGGDGLNAVDVAAPGVVWAVGGSARARGPSQPLVIRLSGHRWSSVPVPGSLRSATLNGVAAWGGRGAWIVGAMRSGGGDRAFGLQADGRDWSAIPVDLSAALSVDLNAIWAAAPDHVWAVGSSFDGRWYRPLVEHGIRGRWSRTRVPVFHGYDARLMAVSGSADGGLWAVGSAARSSGNQRVLILHRCATQRSAGAGALSRMRPAPPSPGGWRFRQAAHGSPRWAGERSQPSPAARAGHRHDSASRLGGSRHVRGGREPG
jgi:hypothetical protein